MKSSFLVFLFSIIAIHSIAQTYTAVKDEATVRKQLADVSKNTSSIKCDFVQEKTLNMLSEKLVSKGTFLFKQTNKVRLEYKQPFKYLMVMNNGKIKVQDESKTTQMDMHKNKIFQQVNNIIVGCVQGSALNNPDFQVAIFESNNQLKLDMKPIGKGLKDFFSNIVIFIDKKDYTVNKMQMNEQGGDNTTITFSNKEINGKIADDIFAVAK